MSPLSSGDEQHSAPSRYIRTRNRVRCPPAVRRTTRGTAALTAQACNRRLRQTVHLVLQGRQPWASCRAIKRHPEHAMAIPEVPNDPDALLPRVPTARALTAAGFPVRPKTLATRASRGGGPPYHYFGRTVLYRWGDALEWARSQLSAPVTSAADHRYHLEREAAERSRRHAAALKLGKRASTPIAERSRCQPVAA